MGVDNGVGRWMADGLMTDGWRVDYELVIHGFCMDDPSTMVGKGNIYDELLKNEKIAAELPDQVVCFVANMMSEPLNGRTNYLTKLLNDGTISTVSDRCKKQQLLTKIQAGRWHGPLRITLCALCANAGCVRCQNRVNAWTAAQHNLTRAINY